MNKEESLDLSQVSVANLLNEDAPVNIPEPEQEEATAVAEEPAEEVQAEPATQDEPEEQSEAQAESEETPESETSSEEPSEEEEGPGVIDTLRNKLGYEVEGDFKDDYDGVVSFTQTVAQEIAKEQLDTVFTQYPDVEQYLQYRYNGGDPKQYFQAQSPDVDFNQLQLAEDDLASQRMIVEQHMSMQGYTPEEVQESIQEYIEAGILHKHAQRGLTKLQVAQKQRAEQVVKDQQQHAEQHRQQVEQQWTSIQSTIDAGRLKGFEVPASDRKKFYKWMSEAVDNEGRTQRSLDRAQMDLETQLTMEYLAWKNFDLNKLVTNTSRTKEAQNLKSRLKQTQTASKRMKGGNTGYTAPKKLPSLKDLL
jgi:hypothetical protein